MTPITDVEIPAYYERKIYKDSTIETLESALQTAKQLDMQQCLKQAIDPFFTLRMIYPEFRHQLSIISVNNYPSSLLLDYATNADGLIIPVVQPVVFRPGENSGLSAFVMSTPGQTLQLLPMTQQHESPYWNIEFLSGNKIHIRKAFKTQNATDVFNWLLNFSGHNRKTGIQHNATTSSGILLKILQHLKVQKPHEHLLETLLISFSLSEAFLKPPCADNEELNATNFMVRKLIIEGLKNSGWYTEDE